MLLLLLLLLPPPPLLLLLLLLLPLLLLLLLWLLNQASNCISSAKTSPLQKDPTNHFLLPHFSSTPLLSNVSALHEFDPQLLSPHPLTHKLLHAHMLMRS